MALRVAIDATPLLGTPTGIGAFVAGALGALAARDDLDLRAYALSLRGRAALPDVLPVGVTALTRPMPADALLRVWQHVDLPPAEAWTGRVDVVHGTNFVVPPARRAGEVVTVHDLTPVRFPELANPRTAPFARLVQRALRRGALVHTPSAFVAAEVVDLLGADPERVVAVHHGVPPLAAARDEEAPAASGATAGPGAPGAAGAPAPPAPGAPAAGTPRPSAGLAPASPVPGPYLLALGTVEPRKDLPALVRAFDALAESHPDLWLVIAGPDGWGADAVAAAVAAARHGDRIRRLGWVAPARRAALLRGATAYAYPSVYEGFGFPPLEAMACDVPVVATTAGALPEVLGDGALLVPPGDVEALADGLEQVLVDRELRAALTARGRRRIEAFDWARCGAGLAELYRRAAG